MCQETKRGKTNVTKEAYVVALWERFGTTTLHFSIAPKKNISMREATEFNLQNFEDISKTLDGSLATLVAEGKLFAPRSKYEPLRKGLWKFGSAIDSIFQNMHQAKVHVFTDALFCLGTHAMCEVRKFSTSWKDHMAERPPRKESKFIGCEFHANPKVASIPLLEAIKRTLPLRMTLLEKIRQTRTRHRIIFMTMMDDLAVANKPHRRDEPNFQNAAFFRDHAGYWVFVSPGSQ